MPLERKDIVKSDFPTARRGYAPDAVAAHLRAIADEVEALREAQSRPRIESVAAGASEQVRQIVEAAEASAAEIRAGAEREAKDVRDAAAAEGRAHVARVRQASERLVARVGEMDAEVARLVEGLAAQLGAGDADVAAARTRAAASEVDDDVATHAVDAAVEPEPQPEREPEPAAPAPKPVAPGDDSEGARLIALNMALSGTPRDETDRFLSENFTLEDREALLEEVYARVSA